jgi:hypothetical protein
MASDPTRVVADADVLAADLFVGGSARRALDHVRRHAWMTLVASDSLLGDTVAVITHIADADLASAWRTRIERFATLVDHPPDDHPALGCVRHGDAAHLLTLNPELHGAETNVSLKRWVEVSVRSPDAFDRLFDPAALYDTTGDGEYPGPDRDPRV